MKRRVEEISFNSSRPVGVGGGGVVGGGGLSGTPTSAAAAAAAVLSNAQHRVMSTQSVTQTSNIQYQVNPGVLKVTSVQVAGNNNNNNNSTGGGGSNVTTLGGSTGGGLGNSSGVEVINSCSTIIGGQNSQATGGQSQFGTYPNAITVSGAANILARTTTQLMGSGSGGGGGVGGPQQQQQQQVHVVNSTQNLIRHKPGGNTVTVAQSPSVIGGNGTSIVTLSSQQATAQQSQQQPQVTMIGTIQTGGGPQQQQQQAPHLPTNMISVTATTPGGASVTTANLVTTTTTTIGNPPPTPPTNGAVQFQRLKVEDALVYLDNVKSKFGDQPQVYNDFLDIMKEFKSQSIDTPGVIERVSTLFKGHPDLIVGFNTFLPPGYKIEIQANDTGYSYQVSVSMPDRSSTTCGPLTMHQQPQHSPSPKLQIIQGSGTMITQTGPVNLVAHPPMLGVGGSGGALQQGGALNVGVGNLTASNNSGTNNTTISLHNNGNASGVSASPGGGNSFVRNDKDRNATGAGGQGPAVNSGAISMNLTAAAAIRSNADEHHAMNHHGGIHQVAQHAMQAHAMQQGGDGSVGLDGQPANQNQPVEFQSAISYVNKIKKRFTNEPDKYKRFLEILHQYQKEQKTTRGESQQKPLTEQEVYSQVAILFDKNEDLLKEFGKFLPDAANSSLHGLNKSGGFVVGQGLDKKADNVSSGRGSLASGSNSRYSGGAGGYSRLDHRGGNGGAGGPGGGPGAGGPLSNIGNISGMANNDYGHHYNNDYKDQYHHLSGTRDKERGSGNMSKYAQQVKRSPSAFGNSLAARNSGGLMMDRADGGPPSKKHKSVCRDVSLAEASKYGTLTEYAFFDKVRRALRNSEVYDNFLRCLTLFNQEIITKPELLNLTSPFLVKHPELHKWFQDFLGPVGALDSGNSAAGLPYGSSVRDNNPAGVPPPPQHSQEIDLSTCKRLGASYCALPKSSEMRKCSGRTALCREVLNDTWVSFPTWAEDSTFVTSRKTQYEELIYRCEDERFELDVVIETNNATIRVLEGVHKKMSRMSVEELMRYRLDDNLGGTSNTIHQRALRRIYGEKAADIIQGLKRNPSVAVPVVLRRLKGKEEEWREAQKGFNKQWRDQNEKYYLKSLDHQGINFKPADMKLLRSKSLFNDIETLYDERHEHNEDHSQEQVVSGPHLVLPYKDKTILEDATNLLIHHVKRQTGVQKQEKSKIKHILRQFVPDLFFSPRLQLSDDEREESNSDEGKEKSSGGCKSASAGNAYLGSVEIKEEVLEANKSDDVEMEDVSGGDKAAGTATDRIKDDPDKDAPTTVSGGGGTAKNMDEEYTLFFANNNWYLFLRLHAILCERLRTMYDRAQILAAEEAQYKSNRRESTATALRLKARSEIQVEDYYPTFLDMLKNVLDGNLDGNNFEDSLREMFGIHAYIAFTLDRVVQNAVRQLQHCVTERAALDCVALFTAEQKQNGAGGLCRTASKRSSAELSYQRKAEQKLQDENCFKVYIYKIDCRVTIELLDTESDDTEKSVTYNQEWSSYVERYANPGTGPGLDSGQNNGPTGNYLEIKGGSASPMDTSSGDQSAGTGGKSVNSEGGASSSAPKDSAGKKSKAHGSEESDKLGGGKQPRRPFLLRRNIRNKDKQQLDGSAAATIGPNGMMALESPVGAVATTNKDENKQLAIAKEEGIAGAVASAAAAAATTTPATRSDYQIVDNTEVKLNMNSYKMVWVTNKHGLFYKRNSIAKARKNHPSVTKRLKARFSQFTDKWAATNVNKVQETQCLDWMLGKVVLENSQVVPSGGGGMGVATTTVCKDNDIARTPYFLYNRYKVFKGDR